MKTNEQIVTTLEKLKDEQNLSISELARRVGMAKSALSRYFNRTREFPLNRIDTFAKVLNTTPEQILGLNNEDHTKVAIVDEDEELLNIVSKLNENNKQDIYKYALFLLHDQKNS